MMATSTHTQADPGTPEPSKDMTSQIGDALDWCKKHGRFHRVMSGLLFFFLALIIVAILSTIMWFIIDPEHYKETSKNFMYVFYIIAAPIFGVGVGLYKFHIKEVARCNHFFMGFKRISIAGQSHNDGFGTEVRKALTNDAFPPFESQSKEKATKPKTKKPVKKDEDAAD